jgi:hypothetical protein
MSGPDRSSVRLPYAALLSPGSGSILAFTWIPALDALSNARFLTEASDIRAMFWIRAMSVATHAFTAWYAARQRSKLAVVATLALMPPSLGLLSIPLVRALTHGWHTIAVTLTARFLVASPIVFCAYPCILGLLIEPSLVSPSEEAADRTLMVGMLWVAGGGLVKFALALVTSGSIELYAARHEAVLHLVVPFAIAGAAWLRASERRRWLRKVVAGQDPRWRIFDQPGQGERQRADLTRVSPGEPRLLLARVVAANQPF